MLPTLTLPNASAVGDTERLGKAATPAPESEMGMVLPPPVMVYVALSVIAAAGPVRKHDGAAGAGVSVAPLHVPDLVKLRGCRRIHHVGRATGSSVGYGNRPLAAGLADGDTAERE